MVLFSFEKLSTVAHQNPHLMDTSSVRQVGNSIVWSAGPVTEDSASLGKAVPCAGSLPMGIMYGMRLFLLVKVKYFIQAKINTLIKD